MQNENSNYITKNLDDLSIWDYDNQIFEINNGNFPFSIFWKKNTSSQYLLISLNNGRIRKPRYFERYTWANAINFNILCIEDPSMSRLKYGNWFYGSVEYPLIVDIEKLIQNCVKVLSIKNENIIFIGSSSGGYASLYLSYKFQSSTSISINPQIKIKEYGNIYEEIEKKFGTIDNDKFLRNDISYIFTKHNNSKTIIITNKNHSDKIQLDIITEQLQIKNVEKSNVKWNFKILVPDVKFNISPALVHKYNQLNFVETMLLINAVIHKKDTLNFINKFITEYEIRMQQKLDLYYLKLEKYLSDMIFNLSQSLRISYRAKLNKFIVFDIKNNDYKIILKFFISKVTIEFYINFNFKKDTFDKLLEILKSNLNTNLYYKTQEIEGLVHNQSLILYCTYNENQILESYENSNLSNVLSELIKFINQNLKSNMILN